MKRRHQYIIYNLQEIIDINENHICFIKSNSLDDIKKDTIQTCENTKNVCTKILNETEIYLIELNKRIHQICCHEFVNDMIDISPDKSMRICYCKICEYTDC